jgi:short-subunit dehydrogenase
VGYPDWVWLNAADVASQGIKDCERGKVISVPDIRYQALAQVARHAPRSLLRRASKVRGE